MTNLLAQTPVNLGQFNGIGTISTFNRDATGGGAFGRLTSIISLMVGLLTIVAGLYFIIQVMVGAINWLGAGGDKAQVENGRKKITNAVIGLTVVVCSYALISVIGMILGFNILNPANALGVPGA